MKSKWLWLGLIIAGTALVLFLAAIFIIVFANGGTGSLAWGEGVGLVEVKGVIIDSQETVKQLSLLQKCMQ